MQNSTIYKTKITLLRDFYHTMQQCVKKMKMFGTRIWVFTIF